jgi:thiol-disulfide isomerase/thioredoxin
MRSIFKALFLVSLTAITLLQSAWANDGALSKLQAELKSHQGKVIYLDFWASWCVPCRQSFPWLNEMEQKYQAQGFKVIAVNLDEESELASAFLEKWPAEFTVLFDAEAETAEFYQLKGMPSSFILGRDGAIAKSHVGFFMKNTSNYEAEIRQLLESK